jgi:uncharacterized protein YpmB
MIPSRQESRRKLPNLSFARWTLLLAGFLLFLLVSFILFIRSADATHHHAEKTAIRIAKAQAGLTDVRKAVRHTWDETVWVVFGKDATNVEWMVWERDNEVIKLKVSENESEKQMLRRFKDEHNGEIPIRMLPGWFQNEPVWEVRYWSELDAERQAIDFYSFKDGSRLKTYELPVQY